MKYVLQIGELPDVELSLEGELKQAHIARDTIANVVKIASVCGEWCGEEQRGYDHACRNPL